MLSGGLHKATVDQPTSLGAATATTTGVEVPTARTPAELAPVLTLLNMLLKKVHAALPPRTALVIFTGHSDPRRMSLLNMRKNALKSGKMPEDIFAGGAVNGWVEMECCGCEGLGGGGGVGEEGAFERESVIYLFFSSAFFSPSLSRCELYTLLQADGWFLHSCHIPAYLGEYTMLLLGDIPKRGIC